MTEADELKQAIAATVRIGREASELLNQTYRKITAFQVSVNGHGDDTDLLQNSIQLALDNIMASELIISNANEQLGAWRRKL